MSIKKTTLETVTAYGSSEKVDVSANEMHSKRGKCLLTKSPYRVGQPRTLIPSAFATLFVAIVSILLFYGCQKESTSSPERKKKSETGVNYAYPGCYSWYVICRDKQGNIISSHSGHALGEKAAKDSVKKYRCSTVLVGIDSVGIKSEHIDDPRGNMNAFIVNGSMVYLEKIDPWTNELKRFTQDDISANALVWLSEICDYNEADLSPVDKVVAQLKVWDIYLGGNTVSEILPLHNLTAQQFSAIAAKSWNKITIIQTTNDDDDDDDTIHLGWIFEY